MCREKCDSCEWACWMTVRREGSNCHSIIIELVKGRAYCFSRWDNMTGSDSCCDKWWWCKKSRTRRSDLLSLRLFNGGSSTIDLLWCLVLWELWHCEVGNCRGGQIHIVMLWVVTPYNVAHGYKGFGGAFILWYSVLWHRVFGKLLPSFWKNTLPIFCTLKMRTICCSEEWYLPTRLHGVLNQKTAVLSGVWWGR
jgi:hypothetical protein